MYRLFVFVVFFFSGFSLCSQGEVQVLTLPVHAKNGGFDTTYVADYKDYLSVRGLGMQKFNNWAILRKGQNGLPDQKLELKVNEQFNFGVGFNYKWLGLNFVFKGDSEDDQKFGKTNSFDMQLSVLPRKFMIDAFFTHYKGFYIANPTSFASDWWTNVSNAYPKLSNTTSTGLGGDFLWVFNNKKFSMQAAVVNNMKQLKSAGSWIAGGYTNYLNLRLNVDSVARSFNVRPSRAIAPDAQLKVRGMSFFNLGPEGGYAHTFVIAKDFYVSMVGTAGLGLSFKTIENDNQSLNISAVNLGTKFKFRVAAGFNGPRWYYGISGYADVFGMNTSDSYGNWRLTAGYRFQVKQPKFLNVIF